MTTLETVRGRLEQMLGDPSNKLWPTAALDEAIRAALHDFSQLVPQRVIDTVTVASATYELDISGLTGIEQVEQLWLPYTAANPESPPNIKPFAYWPESQVLYLYDYEAQAGEVARVFYTTLQTLNGLDSAVSTSVPDGDISWLLMGAAAKAAASQSLKLANGTKEGNAAAGHHRDVANEFAATFRLALESLAAKQAGQRTNSLVTAHDGLDRYDGEWQ